jgi:glycosyltransferase involved in cell wall biosynthesis
MDAHSANSRAMQLVIVTSYALQPGTANASRIACLTLACESQGISVRIIASHSRDGAGAVDQNLDPSVATGQVTYVEADQTPWFRQPRGFGIVAQAWKRIASRWRLATLVWHSLEQQGSLLLIYSSPADVGFPCLIAARLRRRPVFFEVNEMVPREEFAPDHRLIAYFSHYLGHIWLPRFSNGVIAISTRIQEVYERRGIATLLLPSLFSGIDVSASEAAQGEVSPPSRPFHVMYVGQGKVEDGVPELLLAIGKLRNSGMDVVLDVVGASSSKIADSFTVIGRESRPLPKWVTVFGWVPPSDYVRHLAATDCFVLPRPSNGTNQANFPTRLPEFLSTGKPVIVGIAGDIPLYLTHGEHALLLQESDADEIASCIGQLVAFPEIARALGKAGGQRGTEVFGYATYTADLTEFLVGNSNISEKEIH